MRAGLLLSLLICCGRAAALVCPTLAQDTNATLIVLTAAMYNATQFQTLAFNGSKWGPVLRLELGQLYQIDVTNADIQEGTSVHWHGQHQANSSWADGATGLTQGVIPAGATFSYRFPANPSGTFWYHSHTADQFGDGLRGPLIVTDPADPARDLYDEDSHLLLLADVYDSTVSEQLAALQFGMMGGGMGGDMGGGGHGSMAMCPGIDVSDAPWVAVEVNGESFATTGRAAVFRVQQGKRYRFRTICGTSSWALQVSIAAHNLTVIALDGQPITPAPAKAFLATSGERVDFVLHADQPVGNYWINVTTIDGHNSPAILSYEGAPDPATDPAVSADAYTPDLGCPDQATLSAAGQQAAGVLDFKKAALTAGPGVPGPPQESTKQFTFFLTSGAMGMATPMPATFAASAAAPSNPYGLNAAAAAALPTNGPGCPDGGMYCWSLNWLAFEMPPSLPIYPATSAAAAAAASASSPSPGTYAISLEQGDVVDLALINPSLMVHPMHLHGASFWVLAAGNGKILDADGHVSAAAVAAYNLGNPVLRDTVPVAQAVASPAGEGQPPEAAEDGSGGTGGMGGMGGGGHMSHGRRRLRASGAAANSTGTGTGSGSGVGPGYTVVRFRADNPGVWAFHCHVDLHMGSGMMLYFTVNPPGGAGFEAPANLECV